jgi:hypothetical protein
MKASNLLLGSTLVIGLSVAGSLHAGEVTTILLPQQDEVRLALEAAPDHLRADATVYVFEREG